jgi:hypothetical protein
MNKGEKGLSGDEVAAEVMKLIGDLGTNETQQQTCREEATPKWSAPPQEQLKINTDGSFISNTLQGSWGFIIRDHEGEAILAGVGRLIAVSDALTAETAACQNALQVIRSQYISYPIGGRFLCPQTSSSVPYYGFGIVRNDDYGHLILAAGAFCL